ncbi:aminotransferase A [Salisediminibacterium selenitireducens]|uniref:Aminotransferase n=1 Tax=Bacillus selenitireducens (strain ATCC 700615 / DSM 15326 / MLS10) TaxID=439292 RepID=D6XUR4_BACIE|nr:aminotransferase A [Salisediminibacterium selenitireducens]ADH99550.1 aminotransferase class I and II [[Bacillus] selenitireducens MLS10]
MTNETDMNSRIGSKAASIQLSGIRRFFNQVQHYPDAVQLTLGQPDFPTPVHIKEAAINAIEQNHTTYTANAGIMPLREAVSAFMQDKYNLSFHPENEIIVTAGASQAIDTALRTLLDPGDEVLIPAPVYPAYEPVIKLAGATPVLIDTSNTSFKLTVNQIKANETSKTKVIIFPYPSNPTGVVMTKDELIELGDFLQNRPYFVLADEIYSELNESGQHTSIGNIKGMREKTIVINGVSKSHAMTGWRIGFLMAPAYLITHMIKVHQYNISCASSISQYAALAAMTDGKYDAEQMRMAYAKRRDFVLRRLDDIGIPVTEPKGAFYVFPSIKKKGLSSMDFALKLLEQEKLAVVPGDAFSEFGEGYIRISYAYAMAELEEAMNRLERFWFSL